MADSLTTYDELNEDIQFTEEETRALLKLNEKEILILILSEMKKQTELLSKNRFSTIISYLIFFELLYSIQF